MVYLMAIRLGGATNMKTSLLLLTRLLLGGCADTIIMRQLDSISDAEPHAEVALCRKGNMYGYAVGTVFRLDGKSLYRSAAGTYTRFTVLPGKHSIGLAAMGPAGYLESEQEFLAESGKSYYFYTDADTVYAGTESDLKECVNYRYEFISVQKD